MGYLLNRNRKQRVAPNRPQTGTARNDHFLETGLVSQSVAETRVFLDSVLDGLLDQIVPVATDVLTALSPQDSAADTSNCVVHLVRRPDDQHFAGELDHRRIARKQSNNRSSKVHKQHRIEGSKQQRHPQRGVRRSHGSVLGRRANEPRHSCRRSHGDRKRDLVDRGPRGCHDGLRGQRGRSELGRGKRDDLERQPLGLDHDDSRTGQPQSLVPVAENVGREPAPAPVAVDEPGVAEKHRGHAPVGDHHGCRCSEEPNAKPFVPNQLVVEKDVQRSAQHQHQCRRVENSLCLQELFEHLKHNVARDSVDESLEFLRSQVTNTENRGHRQGELEKEGDHQRQGTERQQAELLHDGGFDLQDQSHVGCSGGDQVQHGELRHGRFHRGSSALDVVFLADGAVLVKRLIREQRHVVVVQIGPRGGPSGSSGGVH
ncbi:hypothetical protein OGAPHI_003254 [Ogataea philodendri]|uniref:Uncharacterized protein n=1 Tax=Ogataea philodendri TaxID=1378263 RepID=A0A9P8P872_9ASCO|nr:uncharacterized protein OGAPHI_003254 [Ogataea philodendri]KAH3666805.1 hypothetical protein OGAPHI_003254 [Ogataea philodendri]